MMMSIHHYSGFSYDKEDGFVCVMICSFEVGMTHPSSSSSQGWGGRRGWGQLLNFQQSKFKEILAGRLGWGHHNVLLFCIFSCMLPTLHAREDANTTQTVGALLKALHQFPNSGGPAGTRSSTQKSLLVIAFSLPSLQELETSSFYTMQLKCFGFNKVNSKRSGYSHCEASTELFYISIHPNSATSKWSCDGNSCSLLHFEPLVMAIACRRNLLPLSLSMGWLQQGQMWQKTWCVEKGSDI